MGAGEESGAEPAVRSAPGMYVSGERVFGPPVGTFDVEWVAREVDRSTAATFGESHQAVSAVWNRARAAGTLDGATLTAAAQAAGASRDVAEAAVTYVIAYCRAYAVDPAAR